MQAKGPRGTNIAMSPYCFIFSEMQERQQDQAEQPSTLLPSQTLAMVAKLRRARDANYGSISQILSLANTWREAKEKLISKASYCFKKTASLPPWNKSCSAKVPQMAFQHHQSTALSGSKCGQWYETMRKRAFMLLRNPKSTGTTGHLAGACNQRGPFP